MRAALAVAQRLEHARLAPTTRSTYATGQRAWTAFLHDAGIGSEELGDADLVVLLRSFVGWLWAKRGPIKLPTVRTYLSGVAQLFREQGRGAAFTAAFRELATMGTLEGVRQQTPGPARAPGLTIYEIQDALHRSWATGDLRERLIAMLVVLAGTLLLRIHEYIPQDGEYFLRRQAGVASRRAQAVGSLRTGDERTWRTNAALRWEDVSSAGHDVAVRQLHWKHSRPGDERRVLLQHADDARPWLCAECWVRRMWQRARTYGLIWLAQLDESNVVRESELRDYLRAAAARAGRPDAHELTGHSLRRGGATDMLEASGDVAAVRALGRWRSETGINPYLVVSERRVQTAVRSRHERHQRE